MGRQKLTLVVTCTDRKSARPDDTLLVRNLPNLPPAERSRAWFENLRGAARQVPLRQLYQGEAWTQVLQLERTAQSIGFETRLLVASAGLGLARASDLAPAYGATFAPRQPDSVANDPVGGRAWWQALKARTGAASTDEWRDSAALFVLSETYAHAMADDMVALAGRTDVVVFGGSRDVPPQVRIPADRQLRQSLGGTTTSLNLRTAIAWLKLLPEPRINGSLQHPEWRAWVDASRSRDSYDRRPMTDAQVAHFIRNLRAADPSMSRSRALRILRDEGMACEQKRFGRLFQEAVHSS